MLKLSNIPKPLVEAILSLQEAQAQYERIKMEYKEEPLLRDFYLNSAEELITYLKEHIKYLNESVLGIENVESIKDTPEVWIRLEGAGYDGKAPIGVVGNFLQKLSNANRVAVNMISKISQMGEDVQDSLNKFATFDLVATAEGSMKLGLKRTEFALNLEQEQLDLFYGDDFYDDSEKQNLEDFKYVPINAIELINKTIESVENPSVLENLKQTYGEIHLQKLLHYTKEILPSNRSSYDSISIEFNKPVDKPVIKATKDIRKKMHDLEKALLKESQYVESKGLVRAVDIDKNQLILRPFKYNGVRIDEIICEVNPTIVRDERFKELIDQIIEFKGILYFNQEEIPTKLKIEELLDNL